MVKKRKSGWADALSSLGLVGYLGALMFFSVIIGLFLGLFFYRRANNIIFIILGIVLGVAAGFLAVYKAIRREVRKKK